MNTHINKAQENKNQLVPNIVSQKQNGSKSTFQFVENRPEAIAQRKLQEMANSSPQVKHLRDLKNMATNSPQDKQATQPQVNAPNVLQKKGGNKAADYKYGKLNSDTHVHAFNKEGGHVKLLGNVFKYGTKGNQMAEAETFFRENEEALKQKCNPDDYNGLWKWIQAWK